MIKILQYGEGNFLRTFADVYFHMLNSEGGDYGVYVIKPTPSKKSEMMRLFAEQQNKYHVILRGSENGRTVESFCKVESIERFINPFEDHESYLALARDPELKVIVSNTTEAGICYRSSDEIDGFADITYPAKLTKFLFERYRAGLDGLYILPVELIEDNADELKACVDRYVTLWNLPEDFRRWNDEKNFYCNTLVDRIVSGYPSDAQTKAHLENLIGATDGLMTVAEPFGLWAIEKKGEISRYIKEGKHDIEVVLTNDIGYYKKRKVRVLNGSHTNLVPAGLLLGAQTVSDCMTDKRLSAFVENTLQNEIIPYVSSDTAATAAFAESVKDRFRNPFLNHQLVSISLNSASKWKARVLPSFRDYYAAHGKIAPNLTVGFSYLLSLYSRIERSGEEYTVKLGDRTVALKDETAYLEYFAEKKSIYDFMANVTVWGEDLTRYAGFYETVTLNIKKISNGDCLL